MVTAQINGAGSVRINSSKQHTQDEIYQQQILKYSWETPTIARYFLAYQRLPLYPFELEILSFISGAYSFSFWNQ